MRVRDLGSTCGGVLHNLGGAPAHVGRAALSIGSMVHLLAGPIFLPVN